MSPRDSDKYRFEIDASVVYQLGEMLISDEIQALVELIKNSYDADASFSNVIVETNQAVGELSDNYGRALGYIVVEDDGTGMDEEAIKRGWLTISASVKKELKQAGKTTSKGRTPLGDKGLGRLGSQRLGRYIEIWTTPKGKKTQYYVGIDWGDFGRSVLSEVPVIFRESKVTDAKAGTKIVISGLKTPNNWIGEDQSRLIGQITQMLFPVGEVRAFQVFLTIDGQVVDFEAISHSILDVANQRIEFQHLPDGTYALTGMVRLSLLKPSSQADLRKYQEYIERDGGNQFYEFLEKSNLSFAIRKVRRGGWFVAYKFAGRAEDIGAFDLATNPGPFEGKIFSYNFRTFDFEGINEVFSKQKDFSDFVKKQAGVRVYRDGFGIRPFGINGNDWLRLGSEWTGGRSYYGLRPDNVVGFVKISAKENDNLLEATDREGFVENSYSKSFHGLMDFFVEKVNLANHEIRRSYVEFIKNTANGAGPEQLRDTEDLLREIRTAAMGSLKIVETVRQKELELKETSKNISEILSTTKVGEDKQNSQLFAEVKKIHDSLESATLLLKQIESLLRKSSDFEKYADILEADYEIIRNELTSFSELAGLGITAEALSHEISIIVGSLSARANSFSKSLKGDASAKLGIKTFEFVEEVRASVNRIRKQLSHLDPSLRYIREERNAISMQQHLTQLIKFYGEGRLSRTSISISIEPAPADFNIRINKGKLNQIFDNLILNSEYWLKDDMAKGNIPEDGAKIVFRINNPMVEIYDTGRGVSKSIENHVFKPFVTAKPKGRGLGLFIVRQLLESEDCQIDLLPERNNQERLYIFRLNFTGALDERQE